MGLPAPGPAARSGGAASQRGTSLIELMLLLGACSVVIGGLLSGVVSLNSQRQLREERLLAVSTCRTLLEDLRRNAIDDLAAANGRGFAVRGIHGAGTGLQARAGDPDGLPGRIAVRPERIYGGEVLYRVTVAVDWTGASPNGHVHLTTLMGRRR